MKSASLLRFLLLTLLLVGLLPQQAAAQGTTFPRACSRSVIYNASTSGATQLVPVTNDRYAGNTIYVCGYIFSTAATGSVSLVYGTGTNCGTGQVAITPPWTFATSTAGIASLVDEHDQPTGVVVPAGQNLCILVSAAISVQAIVYFDNNPL